MAASLAGLGGYLPPGRVTNADICVSIDSDPEWIESRTGIRERRFARDGESTGALAVEAGRRALDSAGRSSADAVVVATTSPERLCPAVAPEVASRLGMGGVAAFDLTSACSGFLYGLAASAGLIASAVADDVLFIASEAFSAFVDQRDRTTAPLFGDGSGAVLLSRAEGPGGIGSFDLGSDGDQADLLAIPAGGARQRLRSGLGGEQDAPRDWYLRMNGQLIFRNAITRMARSARTVLDKAGWPIESVDHFVGHQANVRILDAVAEELGVPKERVAVNIDHTGNTLAASIPILLTEMCHSGRLRAGHRVLITAFGAGLSWGSTVMVWPEISVAAVDSSH